MGLKVVKRDGILVDFDANKIVEAISKACREVGEEEELLKQISRHISREIEKIAEQKRKAIKIEEIQDLVVKMLKDTGFNKVSKVYQEYRERRTAIREANSNLLKSVRGVIDGSNDDVLKENANKNGYVSSIQRDLVAGEISRAIAKTMIPEDIIQAHYEGLIKIHDLDYYMSPIHNCGLINLQSMYTNGTVINGVKIETPKSLRTAMNLATQIVCQVASQQYGGNTISLGHMAPFVRVSKNKLIKKYNKYHLDQDTRDRLVNEELKGEIKDSVQLFNYQLLTLNSTNGQSPFTTLVIDINEDVEYTEEIVMLAEEFLKQRIQGMPNDKGVFITQTFPKIIYMLDENNIYENSKYYWLTRLCAECTVKRMVPDYMSVKMLMKHVGAKIPTMGCRSELTPLWDEEGNLLSWGRGNVGVTTINLPYVALLSKEENRDFFEVLDEKLELCKKMGCLRFDKLKGVKASISPILWQHGAYLRLQPDEEILPHLKKLFTVSLGYSGLYDCVKVLTGESHTDGIGKALGLTIMEHLDDKCKQWKEETGYLFGVYGTPMESSTDWFCKAIKRRFGEVKDVTDKGYIVNSYHIDPREEIDAFTKLSVEAEFQKHSLGGSISYVETPDMTKNIEAVLDIMRHIYENNIYGELNIECDYCAECGSFMVANLDENQHWSCGNCGCDDYDKLNIIRRCCGYIADMKHANEGRLNDVKARVKHI